MIFEKKKITIFSDDRGTLVPTEFHNLPFKPVRMFYVTNVPKGLERGHHAHYETEQILICIQGKIRVKLIYSKKTTYILLKPNEYIYVPKMVWDSQEFLTGNDVLLVLCSTNYNTKDYINNLTKYRQLFSK